MQCPLHQTAREKNHFLGGFFDEYFFQVLAEITYEQLK